jgi:hypothetical protein
MARLDASLEGYMNQTERAAKAVDRILHDAHVRYQRDALRPDRVDMPCTEVRGVKRVKGQSELRSEVFKPEWFTHLRPNFWTAYFETLVYCVRQK